MKISKNMVKKIGVVIFLMFFISILGIKNTNAATTDGNTVTLDTSQGETSQSATYKSLSAGIVIASTDVQYVYNKDGVLTQVFSKTTGQGGSTGWQDTTNKYKNTNGTLKSQSEIDTELKAGAGKGDVPQQNVTPPSDCEIFGGKFFNSCILLPVSQAMLKISGAFLALSGWFFNATLDYSLNMAEFVSKFPVLDIGWKLLRDLANMSFIFIMLVIGIQTILGAGSYNTKKMLGTVVVVAIFLNFSLFFTKVIIDSSNILALTFYNQIKTANGNNAANPGREGTAIADAFVKGLGLTTIYNTKEGSVDIPLGDNILMIGLGGSLLIAVAGFVFLAGAFLFIIRSLVLIFVMMLSPLAFAARVLPSTEKYFSQWFSALISQSFFAPAYLFFIYIIVATINGKYGLNALSGDNGAGLTNMNGTQVGFAAFLSGGYGSVSVLYTYTVLIGLLLGSVIVASKMGAVGGKFAEKTVKGATGALAFGMGAGLARNTVGRASKALQNSAMVKKFASQKGIGGLVGRNLEKGLGGVAASSFDIRTTGVGKSINLGESGGKGGFTKLQDEKKKDLEAQKKRVESKSVDEELDITKLEQEKGISETLRANALLDERGVAENQRKIEQSKLDAIKARESDKTNAQKNIDDAKTAKNDANIKFHNETKIYFDELKKATTENEKQTWRDAIKAKEVDRDTELSKQEEVVNQNQKIVDKYNKELADATGSVKKFEDVIKETNKRLSDINEDFNESGEDNDKIEKKMRDDANKQNVIDYVDANGNSLRGKSSGEIGRNSSRIGDEIKKTGDISKDRGKDYAKPDKLDEFLANKLKLTTAQMRMAQDLRDGKRKDGGKNKKIKDKLEELNKLAGIDTSSAATPAAATPPPAAGGATTP